MKTSKIDTDGKLNNLREKSGVFSEWLDEFDTQQRTQITIIDKEIS